GEVFEHVLVDAVVVPLIERRHLVNPDDLAGVDLAGEDAHRPLVVPLAAVAGLLRHRLSAAAVLRAPQSGIAAGSVDQLQVRIVAVPTPHGAATALPLVSRITGDADVMPGSAVFRMLLVGVLGETHVLVASGVVAMPDFLAGLQIVGKE